MVLLVSPAFASRLEPPIAPTGLGLMQATIDVAHDHSTVVVTRPTAGRPGFSRVLISQSAGLVIVVHVGELLTPPRHANGTRSRGVPPTGHVKMKNRLHREKEATCNPSYSYGCDCCCPCYQQPPSELQHSVQGLACATRNGPGWGDTSPQRSSGRGGGSHRHAIKGGEDAEPWSPQRGEGVRGGGYLAHSRTHLLAVRGREGRGQREGSIACLQVSRYCWARRVRYTEAK